jgi:glycosyltransferase involved in cell wall biosynthesis
MLPRLAMSPSPSDRGTTLAAAPPAPRHDLVAVIPAYRCAGSVGKVVEGVRRIVPAVIVIDDGSDDPTAEAARAAGAAVEVLERNRGKGFALRRGIQLALTMNPAAVVLLDADGQHDPEDLPSLISAWDRGQGDLVVGTRLAHGREVMPSARYWTNYIGSRILSWMTGWELEDSQSGYRLLAADLLRRMPLTSDGYAIESEMLLKAARRGARLAHAPIRVIYEGAQSHFQPLRDTVRISLAAIRVKVFDDG